MATPAAAGPPAQPVASHGPPLTAAEARSFAALPPLPRLVRRAALAGSAAVALLAARKAGLASGSAASAALAIALLSAAVELYHIYIFFTVRAKVAARPPSEAAALGLDYAAVVGTPLLGSAGEAAAAAYVKDRPLRRRKSTTLTLGAVRTPSDRFGGGSYAVDAAGSDSAAAAFSAATAAGAGAVAVSPATGPASFLHTTGSDVLRERELGLDAASERDELPAPSIFARFVLAGASSSGGGGTGASAGLGNLLGSVVSGMFTALWGAAASSAGPQGTASSTPPLPAPASSAVGAGADRPLHVSAASYRPARPVLSAAAAAALGGAEGSLPVTIPPDSIHRRLGVSPERLDSLATAVLRAVSRHVLEILLPALRRNTEDILRLEPLPRAFLERRQATAAVPALRPGALTLDQVIAERADTANGRFMVSRPAAATVIATWKSSRGGAGGARQDAGSSGAGAGSGGSGGEGKGAAAASSSRSSGTRRINLWQERAMLESFLSPPGTGASAVTGGGEAGGVLDAKAYALARLVQLAHEGAMQGFAGDDWGVPAADARVADLPTDAQLLSNYLFRLLDAAVAEAAAGAGRQGSTAAATAAANALTQPFTRFHVVFGPLSRAAVARVATARAAGAAAAAAAASAGVTSAESEVVSTVAERYLQSGAKEAARVRLHLPAQTPRMRAALIVDGEVVDVGVGEAAPTRVSLPRALGLLVECLRTRGGGLAGDPAASTSISEVLSAIAAFGVTAPAVVGAAGLGWEGLA